MKFKIVYNPEVVNDIQQAIDWYNEKQPGLGKRFFNTIKAHIDSLKNSALHYAIRYDDVRCMPVKNFPYMVHYRVDKKERIVKIEAVINTSRNPEIWKKKTKA